MPTVIDSLLVKLGLDTRDYDKAKDKVDKGLKKTGGNFDDVAKQAGKFLAVVGGAAALKHFVSNMIEANAELERFSRNIGRNAQDISAWSNEAEIAGGSAEGLRGTMDMLSKSQTELMLTGQSSLVPYFSALGVAVSDFNGKARPVDDLLLDLADRFAGMDRTTANNMGRMMGIDQGTMNLLLKGRAEVELLIKRQKEYGAVTKKQAEEALKLREGITKTKQEFAAFGRELLSRAMPYLEKLFAIFSDIGAWMRSNKEFIADFLTALAVGLGAVGLAVTPINLTALAVTALAAAIALLWQDYQTWKRGGDALMPWDKWMPRIEKAIGWIKKLKDVIADMLFRSIAVGDWMVKMATGDWSGAAIAAQAAQDGMPAEAPAKKEPGGKSPQAFFESQGWSKAQAAGIVANLTRESNMKADAVGDNGKAYGVAQWHPDRQGNFKKWSGKDIRQSTLDEQLAFVDYELRHGNERKAGNALRKAKTAREAGEVVSRLYERPADAAGEAAKRGALASSLYGVPGAAVAAQGAGAPRPSRAPGAPTAAGNSEVTTHIGEIHVHTQATDAPGIARDIASSLDSSFTTQANAGMVA